MWKPVTEQPMFPAFFLGALYVSDPPYDTFMKLEVCNPCQGRAHRVCPLAPNRGLPCGDLRARFSGPGSGVQYVPGALRGQLWAGGSAGWSL